MKVSYTRLLILCYIIYVEFIVDIFPPLLSIFYDTSYM
jgi:hypothetical protein